ERKKNFFFFLGQIYNSPFHYFVASKGMSSEFRRDFEEIKTRAMQVEMERNKPMESMAHSKTNGLDGMAPREGDSNNGVMDNGSALKNEKDDSHKNFNHDKELTNISDTVKPNAALE